MSAMGDRYLMLLDTADALDVFDPELAERFRVVNGLPGPLDEIVGGMTITSPEDSGEIDHHHLSVEVVGDAIAVRCSCDQWSPSFAVTEIDDLVVQIRKHVGTGAATSDDGIGTTRQSPCTGALGNKAG